MTPSNIASMIIACQRKMKNANIVVQPLCLKTSQIIEYSNQASQNSLTQRIVPQLRCLRKLSFIQCQRKMTPANSNHENQNSLTQRIIPQLRCLRKLSFIHSINDHSMSHKNDSSQYSVFKPPGLKMAQIRTL